MNKGFGKGIQNMFAIELGNYYRIFLEIRARKTNASKLLYILKTGLENNMVEVGRIIIEY